MTKNAGIGCYFKNNYNPLIYEFNKPSQIAINVRSFQDSYISADYITRGCSSSDINENYCLTGYSKWDLFSRMMFSYVVSSILMMIIMGCIIICMPLCHKMTSKKYERENLSAK